MKTQMEKIIIINFNDEEKEILKTIGVKTRKNKMYNWDQLMKLCNSVWNYVTKEFDGEDELVEINDTFEMKKTLFMKNQWEIEEKLYKPLIELTNLNNW